MGIDTNVYNGYGIAIFTNNLSEEIIESLKENEIIHYDHYEEQQWFFIPLTAKKIEKLERGIWYNSRTLIKSEFNPTKKHVPPVLIPLFVNRTTGQLKIDEKSKALQAFKDEYENSGYCSEYKQIKKILENFSESWISGKYLVIYYS